MGIKWKDFPKKKLRECTKDCIFFNKSRQCRHAKQKKGGLCPNIGFFMSNMTPEPLHEPRTKEEQELFWNLGIDKTTSNRQIANIYGCYQKYNEKFYVVIFRYLPPLDVDWLFFASATCRRKSMINDVLFVRNQQNREFHTLSKPIQMKYYDNEVYSITEILKHRNERKSKKLTGTGNNIKQYLKSDRIWSILEQINESVPNLQIPFDKRTFAFGYDEIVKKFDNAKKRERYTIQTTNFTQAEGTNKYKDCSYALGLNKFRFPFGYKYLVAEFFKECQIVDDLENEKQTQAMGRTRKSKIVLFGRYQNELYPNIIVIDLEYFCREYIHNEILRIMEENQTFSRNLINKNDLYKQCPHSIRLRKQRFLQIVNEETDRMISVIEAKSSAESLP